MIFNFYFIRHGESESNADPRQLIGQSPSVKLTKTGEEQSKALGTFLLKNNINFDLVFSSTYLRAIDTAKLTCEIVNIPKVNIVSVNDLREYSAGSLIGTPRKDLYNDPNFVEQFDKLHMGYKFPDGESLNQVERRASVWLEDRLIYNPTPIWNKQFGNDDTINIAIFSHGQTLKSIFHYIMGFDKSFIWKIHMPNTAVSNFQYDTLKGWSLKYLNSTAHLQGDNA